MIGSIDPRVARRRPAQGWFSCALLAGALVFAPRSAEPCSCVQPPPPLEALAEMGAVFHGEVVSIVPTGEFNNLRVTFDVFAIWKGPIAPTISVETANNGAECGYPFELGVEYIVYAWDFDGVLHPNLCTRTQPFNEEEAAALGEPIAVFGEETPPFVRGDSNADGRVDISDAIDILNWLFIARPDLACRMSADVDGSGGRSGISITDPIVLLDYLFRGGTQPAAPFPACGTRPVDPEIPCDAFPPCAE